MLFDEKAARNNFDYYTIIIYTQLSAIQKTKQEKTKNKNIGYTELSGEFYFYFQFILSPWWLAPYLGRVAFLDNCYSD